MKHILMVSLLFGCTSYNGITTRGDDILVVGYTQFWFIYRGWVMKCRLEAPPSTQMICEDLEKNFPPRTSNPGR